MKILSPLAHGVLDYLSVVVIALAPTILGFSGTPALLAYALAATYLVVSLLTAMPLGVFKVLPFKAGHRTVEILSLPLLFAAPWLFGFADQPAARWFFLAMGAFATAVILITDWNAASVSQAAHPQP